MVFSHGGDRTKGKREVWVPLENQEANRVVTRGIVVGPTRRKSRDVCGLTSAICRMRRGLLFYFICILRNGIFAFVTSNFYDIVLGRTSSDVYVIIMLTAC